MLQKSGGVVDFLLFTICGNVLIHQEPLHTNPAELCDSVSKGLCTMEMGVINHSLQTMIKMFEVCEWPDSEYSNSKF